MTRTFTRFSIEAVLLVVMIVTVVPIAWLIVTAFLPNRAIVNSRWDFPFWLGNFETLFADDTFVRQIANSAGIVVGTVVLTLLIAAIGGYAIAKLNPPRWILLPALLVAAFIPLVPPATMVPGFYILLGDLNLLGTVTGLILVNTFFNLPFALLLMASYFGSVPDELREASQMDGATELRTFFSVVLPIVRPGMAAVAIFVAIMAWNEFLMGLTLTAGGDTAPVTVGIANLLQAYTVTWGELAAAGAVAAGPIIVLAIFANRHIVAGLTAGAIKG